MKNFALIENGIVVNVSVADENWDSTGWIEYTEAAIGWTYDSDLNVFIPPRPECGHKELFLNDQNKWNCQRCELNAKSFFDEA
jgi:hypothetical protein